MQNYIVFKFTNKIESIQIYEQILPFDSTIQIILCNKVTSPHHAAIDMYKALNILMSFFNLCIKRILNKKTTSCACLLIEFNGLGSQHLEK